MSESARSGAGTLARPTAAGGLLRGNRHPGVSAADNLCVRPCYNGVSKTDRLLVFVSRNRR